MKQNPYQAYKQQTVMTMTQGDMLTTLYNELIKELNFALAAFDKKDYVEINRSLKKAQLILNHFRNSLDFKYEIAENLRSLYDYFYDVALQANLKKSPNGLSEIITMITELRDTYIQADKQARAQTQVAL